MASQHILLLFCLVGLVLFAADADAARQRKNKKSRSGRVPSARSDAAQVSTTNSSTSVAVAAANAPMSDVPPVAVDATGRSTSSESSRKSRRKQRKSRKKAARDRRNKKNGKQGRKESIASEDDSRRKMISSMREMFGFDHMVAPRHSVYAGATNGPRSSGTRLRGSVSDQRLMDIDVANLQPPEFMVDLYRTFSADQSQMHMHFESQGNTVRSFFSIAGNTPSSPQTKGKSITIAPLENPRGTRTTATPGSSSRHMKVFAFNVTSIPLSETVVASELRMDGLRKQMRRQGTNTSEWSIVVGVYTISEMEESEGNTRNVYTRVGNVTAVRPSTSSAWIDSSLKHVVTESRTPGHVLVVKFFDETSSGLSRSTRDAESAPERSDSSEDVLSADLPLSFVVIETERSKRYSGDNRNYRPTPTSSNIFQALQQQSSRVSPILVVYCNDTRTIAQPTSAPNAVWKSLLNVSQSLLQRSPSRVRRSARRRLPELSEPSTPTEDNGLPGDGLASKHHPARGRRPGRTQSVIDNGQTEPSGNVLSKLKSRSESKKCRKKGKGKKRRCKGKRRPNKKPCKKRTQDTDLNRSVRGCSRKSMNVEFGDFGWDDWIIAPKNLEAYYCSGTCESTKMKKSSPTNHAILQALVQEFGNNPEVPAPCCVPEKLMAVSVLFFSEDDVVVLKSYPDMSVQSCGCR